MYFPPSLRSSAKIWEESGVMELLREGKVTAGKEPGCELGGLLGVGGKSMEWGFSGQGGIVRKPPPCRCWLTPSFTHSVMHICPSPHVPLHPHSHSVPAPVCDFPNTPICPTLPGPHILCLLSWSHREDTVRNAASSLPYPQLGLLAPRSGCSLS